MNLNVVVVMVDTLPYDYVSFHDTEITGGFPRPHTPNIDAFCAGAWVFDRYYTASYPTIPHRTDVLTGEYGAPLHPWRPLSHSRTTLPMVLSSHGYLTQLIHDTPHLVNGGHGFDYPFDYWSQIRGAEVDRPWPPLLNSNGRQEKIPSLHNWHRDPLFDEFFDDQNDTVPPMLYSYAGANADRTKMSQWNCARLFNQAARFCTENQKRDRFFLWVDCFDPHEPWDVPPEFFRRYDPRKNSDGKIDPRSFFVHRNIIDPKYDSSSGARLVKSVIAAQYAAKTAWMDHCFGTLVSSLVETGLDRNTVVILVSDHGTNVGQPRLGGPKFSKGWPVRQSEAHCVCAVRVPEGGSGRCSAIVQPQDLWATICAVAEIPVRSDIDSQDIVALARGGGVGTRNLALAGRAANYWSQYGSEAGLVTAFNDTWSLELSVVPEQCRLVRIGGHKDVAANNTQLMDELRRETLDELERRSAHHELMRWLRSEGRYNFPEQGPLSIEGSLPTGYKPYFEKSSSQKTWRNLAFKSY